MFAWPMHAYIAYQRTFFFSSFNPGPSCPQLPAADINTKMTLIEGDVTALDIQCIAGYNMTEGSGHRFCTTDRTWSGIKSVCSGKLK